MKKLLTSLFGAAVLLTAPLALTACETETQREVESDGDVDYDTEIGIDESEVDEAQQDMENLGNEIQEGAQEAGDAIDENIDLGDNAGTPEVDDNN